MGISREVTPLGLNARTRGRGVLPERHEEKQLGACERDASGCCMLKSLLSKSLATILGPTRISRSSCSQEVRHRNPGRRLLVWVAQIILLPPNNRRAAW